MARTLIFLAPVFPHPVSRFLLENGYTVLEARTVDEAQFLSVAHDIDAVLIAPGNSYVGLEELRRRRKTIDLAIHATGPEIYFELSHLFMPNPQLQ